jgi:quinol monooxygenase YgiN
MLIIIGTVRMPPQRLDDARPIMRRMVEATLAEGGCEAYSYADDMFEPGLIHVSERWRDRAALEAHFAAPHTAAWRAAWPALGIGDRRLSLYESKGPEPI